MKFLASTLATTALVSACSTYSSPYSPSIPERNTPMKDLFPGVIPGKLTFISPEQARRNNVAHVVTRYKGKIIGICHFGRVNLTIDGKRETLISTAGHCVNPNGYINSNGTVNNAIDYILARSLTRLFKPEVGIEFLTTDSPRTLERSDLSGKQLDGATLEMSGCLPHSNGKNSSTCFHYRGTSYMHSGANGQATVYFNRKEYIDLLLKAERSCKDAYLSGVSGNHFTDQNGKMVGIASTAINACSLLIKEKYYNEAGIPMNINAFPVTFEPIRESKDGKSRVILN